MGGLGCSQGSQQNFGHAEREKRWLARVKMTVWGKGMTAVPNSNFLAEWLKAWAALVQVLAVPLTSQGMLGRLPEKQNPNQK